MNDFGSALFSDHALSEIKRRGLDKSIIIEILKSYDTLRPVREGRVVLHKTSIAKNGGKALLYRVFIDVDRMPPVVVTAYATSKIRKYEVFQ